MANFSNHFLKAVRDQNDLLSRVPKLVTSISLRDVILQENSIDSYRLVIKLSPFYKWVDGCFATVYGFDPLSITIEDATWIHYFQEIFTNKRVSRAKLQNWVEMIDDILESKSFGEGEHQIINFVKHVCFHCWTFGKSNDKTRLTLTEQVSERSLTWVIEFAHAVGTLLVGDKSIKEFQISILCLAPNILWIIFSTVDLNGAKFARGIEVIQNIVKAEGCVVEDETMGSFLQSVRLGSVQNEYAEIPDGVHTHSEPMIVRDITITPNINIDGLVLPTPPTVLINSSWENAAKAGSTISLVLMGMTSTTNSTHGVAIDTNTGTVITGRLCAKLNWSDLYSFHFWPYVTGVLEQRPDWNIKRKQSFISSLSYYNGGDENLARFIADNSWWSFLPCLDSIKLFSTDTEW